MNHLDIAFNADAHEVNDGTIERTPEEIVTEYQHAQPVAKPSCQLDVAQPHCVTGHHAHAVSYSHSLNKGSLLSHVAVAENIGHSRYQKTTTQTISHSGYREK